MESSKHLAVREECSSSESGWTMYIDSPMHESKNHQYDDEDDHGHDTDELDHHGHNNKDGEEESDDSMASDASSGPSHRKIIRGSSKARKNNDQCKRSGKNHGQVKKKIFDRRIRAQKEEQQYKAFSAIGLARIGAKVRKPK